MHLHGVEGAQRFEISSRTVKQLHGVGLVIECLLSEAYRRDHIAAMTAVVVCAVDNLEGLRLGLMLSQLRYS